MEVLPSPLTQALQTQFGDGILGFHQHRGDETVLVQKQLFLKVCQFIKDEKSFDFNMMIDLTAVDYLPKNPRFEVVYHFYSLTWNHRIRLKVLVTEEECTLDSIHHLWKAADWYERECYDMYGIQFNYHPHLKRILMYDSFQGHPLRKDYPVDLQQPLVTMREVHERYPYERG